MSRYNRKETIGSRLPAWSRLLEQIAKRDSQHLSDPSQIKDRDVPLAPFYRTDKGPVQAARQPELLLSKAASFPLPADAVPNTLQKLFVVDARHS